MAKASTSRVLGDFKLRKMLRQFPEQVEANLKPAMHKAADLLLADMQRNIPEDTGAGRKALTAFVAKSGLDAQVGLRGKRKRRDFFYLKFLEYGTKGYKGKLYRRADSNAVGGEHTVNRDRSKMRGRYALRQRDTKNKTDGKNWFGYYPDIPARPARPFIRPALYGNRFAVQKLIQEAVSTTLKRIAQRG